MEFVYPTLLYGLFAISIPIIIHLFNFRRYRRVYFPNLNFLKAVQAQTKKRSNLKHLIVLFMRILAITALVFAFAQPYYPASNAQINFEESSAVCIHIDNSFSMEAVSPDGELMKVAKDKAIEIAEAYRPSDNYQILTNDFEGKHRRFVSREDLVSLVDEVTISPLVRPVSEVIGRFSEQLQNNPAVNKVIYIISDFQKSITDLNRINADSSVKIFLVPLSPIEQQNLYIDSCWFESPILRPGHQVTLKVKINNHGKQTMEKIPVKLEINGIQRTVASLDIDGNSSKVVELPYTLHETGIHNCKIMISDYPVIFDDTYYLTHKVYEQIKVLIINQAGPNKYLFTLFHQEEAFDLTQVNVSKIDYASLPKYDLIILNSIPTLPSGLAQEIFRFLEEGGSVVLIPSKDIDLQNYNSFLSRLNANTFTDWMEQQVQADYINTLHPVFTDVFSQVPENTELPEVKSYYKLSSRSKTNQEVLLRMYGGDPLFVVHYAGPGKLYISTVPLDEDYSNLPRHAVFVPLFYKVALISNFRELLTQEIGSNKPVKIDMVNRSADEVIEITQQESGLTFIPEQNTNDGKIEIRSHNQVKQAGNYSITMAQKELYGISYNYNRNESDLECLSPEEIRYFLTESPKNNIFIIEPGSEPVNLVINSLNKGDRLWKLFVIFALVFLALEIAVIRLWKT